MIFVTLCFRLRVEESPVLEDLRKRRHVVKLPLIETVTRYPSSGCRAARCCWAS